MDEGYYTVEDLAESLNVSTQTIRRDIKKLSDDKLLIRHHGGASSASK
ncbi:DeoR family transcriptional regulator [Vibrio lentus]|nr:DeoR family transcriptional regulator [Vibrio lentus]